MQHFSSTPFVIDNLHPDVARHLVAAQLAAYQLGEPDPFPRVPLKGVQAKRRRIVELAAWFYQAGNATGLIRKIQALAPGDKVTLSYPLEWTRVKIELYHVSPIFAAAAEDKGTDLGIDLVFACNSVTKSPYTTAARWTREAARRAQVAKRWVAETQDLGALDSTELAAGRLFRDAAREPQRLLRDRRDRTTAKR